jgi:hypothetical protein
VALRLALVIGLAFFAGCAACGGSTGPKPCESDSECQAIDGEFSRCNVDEGICECVDDRACGLGEICNASGRCQSLSGCVSNEQCVTGESDPCANQFCDILTSQCVSICECGEDDDCCTIDSQCPFGAVCNTLERKCVPGCRADGDCRLGEGCIGAGLLGQLGECAAGVCTANNLCRFGQTCNLEQGECTFDTRGPFCLGCAGGVASDDCGEGGNYCLTDTSDPTGRSEFCGVDCSKGQSCPFGYSCNDVIIIPPSAPFCSAEVCLETGRCSANGNINCTEDEDCPVGLPGGNCPRADIGNCIQDQTQDCERDSDCCEGAQCPEGSCVKQECRGGEGDAFGHCSCTRDLDCPRDSCEDQDLSDPENPRPGRCSLAGHECFDDVDCDVIACIDGGCRIGANCAPANDRNCRELLPSPGATP